MPHHFINFSLVEGTTFYTCYIILPMRALTFFTRFPVSPCLPVPKLLCLIDQRVASCFQVQAELPIGSSKADTADRLLQLWGELDQKVAERWTSGALP